MRLICGFVFIDGRPAQASQLEPMISALTASGQKPDVSHWLHGSTAMAVLEFDANQSGRNLLKPSATGWVSVSDAYLYSQSESVDPICNEFSDDDALISSTLDSFQVDSADRLYGDFAFAAWHTETQSLYCARDIMGVRPFHYVYREKEFFAFASFPDALIQGGFASKQLNDLFIARHIVMGQNSAEESPYIEIRKLAPASQLWLSSKGLEIRRYWQPPQIGTWQGNESEAALGIRQRLQAAVNQRLIRHGKVGSQLSGGLDSSAITVMAARFYAQQAKHLPTFSWLSTDFEGEVFLDEREYIQDVLKQESNIDWQPIYRFEDLCSAKLGGTVLCSFGDIARQTGEKARDAGLNCILSGWGADECVTFRGVGALAEALLRGDWRYLRRELQARHGSVFLPLLRLLVNELLPSSWNRIIRGLLNKPQPKPDITAYLPRLLTAGMLQHLGDTSLKLTTEASSNRKRLLNGYHIRATLDSSAELGAQHGLVYSYPFLDRNLIEYCLSLPSRFFIQNNWDRQPFRDAMEGILPESIRWRRTKYGSFPDAPIHLAKQKPALLDKLIKLRRSAESLELFDFDTIEELFLAIPEGELALSYARQTNREPYPIDFSLALFATRVLAVAGFIANR